MIINVIPFTFIISAGLSYLITFFLIPVLQKNFMDQPNQRSSHIIATPRGGGIAFVVIGTLLNLIDQTGASRLIPIFCLPLALVGLIDDFRELPSIFRYIVQLGTATILVLISNLPMSLWLFATLIVMLTAIINFINFMDGLDGLVAGCSVLLIASGSCWAISGAIFGFLIWNWAPAKVFMGDVGSTFIGGVFGGMALQTHDYQNTVWFLLIGFPLFADAFTCLVRRFMNREAVFKAHRKHLFQRLHQSGWSHQKVSSLYISGVGILLLSYKSMGFSSLVFFLLCEFLIGFYLDRYVATEF